MQSEPLRNECQHFLNVVNNNVIPLTNSEEGLRVLKALTELLYLKINKKLSG